jgi:hypothetical protein
MNFAHLMIAAITGEKLELEENTRGHLTTREMYAVQPDRSVAKPLRRGIANLLVKKY